MLIMIFWSLCYCLLNYRNEEFENTTEEVENSLKLRNLSITRWIARSESVVAVWISFETIQKTLNVIWESENFDKKTKDKAISLTWNLQSVDFVISLMFMKNIMPRMHQMTLALQSEELNIIDALVIIESTVKLLKSIREDESAMNELIDAGIVFLRKISSEDPVNEFRWKHRRLPTPICFDKNPETTAEFQMHQFYRMEFYKFLDLIIKEYGENLSSCFNKLKPLIVVLKPPLSEPTIEDIKSVVKFFPRETMINAYILHGELCNFVAHIDSIFPNDSFESLNEIAQKRRNQSFRLQINATSFC